MPGSSSSTASGKPPDVQRPYTTFDNTSIDIQDSPFTKADGGDSDDIFTASGDNNGSILTGGSGVDDFAVGGIFDNGQIDGGAGNDIITGSGSWAFATARGGADNDWIDLRACTGMLLSLWGDDGNDRMYAGSWGCKLVGGAGFDRMTGGVGDDKFYAVDFEMDVISGGAHDKGDWAEVDWPDFETGHDVDWLNGIEFVVYSFVNNSGPA